MWNRIDVAMQLLGRLPNQKHRVGSSICINQQVWKSNVPDGCICGALACAMPGVLVKCVIVLQYSIFVLYIVLHRVVGLCMQAKIIIGCAMASACHIMACLDHWVKAPSSIQKMVKSWLLIELDEFHFNHLLCGLVNSAMAFVTTTLSWGKSVGSFTFWQKATRQMPF